MFDIITFGSAIKDVFLHLKKGDSRVLPGGDLYHAENLCLSFGAKVFIKDLREFSGGGGTNTACAFSNFGFKTAYVGKIGNDEGGKLIMNDLKKFNVSASFLKKDKQQKTALSIILSSERERTILIYRGACHFMQESDVPWQKIKKAKWFYLAPLSDETSRLFAPLVNFAKKYKIKIAANPGLNQLKLPLDVLQPILKKIDILILNREEASFFTQISPDKEDDLLAKLKSLGPEIVLVTKSREGSIASDGKYFYEAGVPDVPVVDKTGAGDAFGSGFLAGMLLKNDITFSMQLATANASGCVQKVGAKNGLLKKAQSQNLPRLEVNKKNLL